MNSMAESRAHPQVDIDSITVALDLLSSLEQRFRIIGAELNEQWPIATLDTSYRLRRAFLAVCDVELGVTASLGGSRVAKKLSVDHRRVYKCCASWEPGVWLLGRWWGGGPSQCRRKRRA